MLVETIGGKNIVQAFDKEQFFAKKSNSLVDKRSAMLRAA